MVLPKTLNNISSLNNHNCSFLLSIHVFTYAATDLHMKGLGIEKEIPFSSYC